MVINSVKNIIKYPFQKTSIERVASSARLFGIRGTEEQRTQLALDLNNKLFKLIDDVFEQKIKINQKPILKKVELLHCIKQVIPKINIKEWFDPTMEVDGRIKPMLDKSKTKFTGFMIITKTNIEKGVNEDLLRHEMRHVFDDVTQPKILARTNTDALIGRLENYDVNTDFSHFDFYNSFLYPPKTHAEDQEEAAFLTTSIKEHFASLNTPSDEKIEILQNWRSLIKTEKNAYNDEASFVNKENPKEYLEDAYGDFFFEAKIKIVEQVLKDEISAVRKLNAEKYGYKTAV